MEPGRVSAADFVERRREAVRPRSGIERLVLGQPVLVGPKRHGEDLRLGKLERPVGLPLAQTQIVGLRLRPNREHDRVGLPLGRKREIFVEESRPGHAAAASAEGPRLEAEHSQPARGRLTHLIEREIGINPRRGPIPISGQLQDRAFHAVRAGKNLADAAVSQGPRGVGKIEFHTPAFQRRRRRRPDAEKSDRQKQKQSFHGKPF